MGGLKDKVFAIGRQIIQGLINGILGMAGAVANAVGRIAGQVKDGLAHALQIHSPSAMTHEMGRMLGQGLINGLLSQDVPGQVSKILSGVGGSAAMGLNVGVSGGGSGRSGLFSGSPSIMASSGSGQSSGGGGSGGGSDRPIVIQNHLYLDGRELTIAQVKALRLATGQRI